MADGRRQLAVNLLWCVPGRVGGSEEYLARQLVGLHDAAPDLAARAELYVLPGFPAAHPELAARYALTVAAIDGRRRSRRVGVEATWLRRRTTGAALVHHGGGTVPPGSPGPVVLTIHDLQYRDHPRYFSPVKRRYLATVVPRSVRRAHVIAVPSHFVATTVARWFGVTDDRLAVVPHGVEPDLGAARTDPDTLRRRYGLGDGPIAVYPAITHPHKGHRFLVDVLAGPWRARDLVLVLPGGAGAAEASLREAIDAAGLGGRVVRPGRVPAPDRDGLVAMAEALLFPSEYEGFGAPVLEAMAVGTPVVASDRAALPEVVGDAGVVLPLRIDAWADALDTVGRDRDRLVAAGHARAAELTAAASGAALADAYRRVLP